MIGMPKSCMWMRRSKDGNLRKLAHDSEIVVFSLMDPMQCCLSDESLSSDTSASKTRPCDDEQKPNQTVSRPVQSGPGRR
jgi:hypothetical protein